MCLRDLHYSGIVCSCRASVFTCLRHVACSCDPSERRILYRYKLSEMQATCDEMRAAADKESQDPTARPYGFDVPPPVSVTEETDVPSSSTGKRVDVAALEDAGDAPLVEGLKTGKELVEATEKRLMARLTKQTKKKKKGRKTKSKKAGDAEDEEEGAEPTEEPALPVKPADDWVVVEHADAPPVAQEQPPAVQEQTEAPPPATVEPMAVEPTAC